MDVAAVSVEAEQQERIEEHKTLAGQAQVVEEEECRKFRLQRLKDLMFDKVAATRTMFDHFSLSLLSSCEFVLDGRGAVYAEGCPSIATSSFSAGRTCCFAVRCPSPRLKQQLCGSECFQHPYSSPKQQPRQADNSSQTCDWWF